MNDGKFSSKTEDANNKDNKTQVKMNSVVEVSLENNAMDSDVGCDKNKKRFF